MTDQYQAFTQSPIGKFVAKNLGLPAPTTLERFENARPVVAGAVLLGAAPARGTNPRQQHIVAGR